MTTTALPTNPTQLPCGPDTSEIEALHLSITQRWGSGSSHNIHLLENGDLGVILQRGQGGVGASGQNVPSDSETATIVVALGVDGDHDEIHYQSRSGICGEEAITEALEVLVAARDALRRVDRA